MDRPLRTGAARLSIYVDTTRRMVRGERARSRCDTRHHDLYSDILFQRGIFIGLEFSAVSAIHGGERRLRVKKATRNAHTTCAAASLASVYQRYLGDSGEGSIVGHGRARKL